MRAVILAAGEGTRLRPYSEGRPKCLVELAGKPLLVHQLDALQAAGVGEALVVTGYRADQIDAMGLATVNNPDYASTNMVASLMCAREALLAGDEVLVCYADLVYEPRIIQALVACEAPLATTIDLDWLALWRLRDEDPLADAETLKLGPGDRILELGQRPTSLEEIQGQYMGLIKLDPEMARHLVGWWDGLDPDKPIDGRQPARMYMTTCLQRQVDAGRRLQAVKVRRGWLEVDTTRDLETYQEMHRDGRLADFWSPGGPA